MVRLSDLCYFERRRTWTQPHGRAAAELHRSSIVSARTEQELRNTRPSIRPKGEHRASLHLVSHRARPSLGTGGSSAYRTSVSPLLVHGSHQAPLHRHRSSSHTAGTPADVGPHSASLGSSALQASFVRHHEIASPLRLSRAAVGYRRDKPPSHAGIAVLQSSADVPRHIRPPCPPSRVVPMPHVAATGPATHQTHEPHPTSPPGGLLAVRTAPQVPQCDRGVR